MAVPASQLLASLQHAERALASARPQAPRSAFDLFVESLERQYNIREHASNYDTFMQLVTEAWRNLPLTEKGPFEAQARQDMQKYLEEELIYDEMQCQYAQLKRATQAAGTVAMDIHTRTPSGGANVVSYSHQQQQYKAFQQRYASIHQHEQLPARQEQQYQLQQQWQQQPQKHAWPQYQLSQQQHTSIQQHERLPARHEQQYQQYQLQQQWQQQPQKSQQHAWPQQGHMMESQRPNQAPLYQKLEGNVGVAVRQPGVAGAVPETIEVSCRGVYGILILSDHRIICRCSSCASLAVDDRSFTCDQFEIHSGADSAKRGWRTSVKVIPGSTPDVPTSGMPIGTWLERRGIELPRATFRAALNHGIPISRDSRALEARRGSEEPAYARARVQERERQERVGDLQRGPGAGGGQRGRGRGGSSALPRHNSREFTVEDDNQPGLAPESAAAAAIPKAGPYTPWRSGLEGNFEPIYVRWAGEHCSICDGDTDYDEDQLITCDACGITVHQSCYGIPELPSEKQDGAWSCKSCEAREEGKPVPQCCLCPIAGGALKPTNISGVWCHVMCMQWIPEATVEDMNRMEPVIGLRSIQRERWELSCSLCKQRMGAKIQCQLCYTAFHPLCARIAGFKMEILESGKDGTVQTISYCTKHANPTPQSSGVRKIEDTDLGGELPERWKSAKLDNAQPYALPRRADVPKCPAPCARAMPLDCVPWVRCMHGTGTGATTEVGYWIPSDKSPRRTGHKTSSLSPRLSDSVTHPASHDRNGPVDENGMKNKKKSSLLLGNRLCSVNEIPGEQDEGGTASRIPEQKLEEEASAEKVPDGQSQAATENHARRVLPAQEVKHVDMDAKPAVLRPAGKQPSSSDAERPAAKLRPLNNLQQAELPSVPGSSPQGKAVPLSPPADLPPKALVDGRAPMELVGSWCRVWWPEDSEWYDAAIREYSRSRGQHRVWYEVDGEAEWIDLTKESTNGRLQLLQGQNRAAWPAALPPPNEPMPSQHRTTKPKTNLRSEDGQESFETSGDLKGPQEGMAAVGCGVGVRLPDQGKWAYGIIRSYRAYNDRHMVEYENGEVDWVVLSEQEIDWSATKRKTTKRARGSDEGGNATRVGNVVTLAGEQLPHGLPESVEVVCNALRGTLHTKRLVVALKASGREVSPTEFERLGGRGSAKKWKTSLRLVNDDGTPGLTVERWLFSIGIDEMRPRPSSFETVKKLPRRQTSAYLLLRRNHKKDCACVICKQARRNEKLRGGSPGPVAPTKTDEWSKAGIRFGKRAYLEAVAQAPSAGYRPILPDDVPPSRCWAPGEWAVHRTRQLAMRGLQSEVSKLGRGGSQLSVAPILLPGGTFSVLEGNMATQVSLGPGTGAAGRALTLKEKLDICNSTEYERLTFGKSGIHGWGLFARVPMQQDSMVVEFRGEVLRRSVADAREARYLADGTDCYIFNLDDRAVLDATRAGTIARFTNHSCSPSLYTKILALDGELRLAFFARCDISPGQELTYNYRFKAEDGEDRLPCECGAHDCAGYLN